MPDPRVHKKAFRREFGFYFDPTKSTSGQRFFGALCRELARESVPLNQRPTAVLFNVSASIKAMIKSKFHRQKIILRIDGLYFDRLSPVFLATFNKPLRKVFSLVLRHCPRAHDFLAHFANLINQNYGAFARILLADRIIYQSRFSRKVHERYFPRKRYNIIMNGATFRGKDPSRAQSGADALRLVTIHDEWKPAKRIHDLIEFVRWAREKKKVPVQLTILGYTGKLAACSPSRVKKIIETASFIRTLPKFKSFDGEILDALCASDIYITFTYRDPCPNTVIEAMAHGLPVVGMASGGMPDIVGDAGVLLPSDDFAGGFFSPHRYECDFPPIDFEQMLDAVLKVSSGLSTFRARVRKRFETDLAINVVADRYISVMRSC